MFENAKVGDKVVDFRAGEGKIYEIEDGTDPDYPIRVEFSPDSSDDYTRDGKLYKDDPYPSLFPAGTEIIRPVVKVEPEASPEDLDVKSLLLLVIDKLEEIRICTIDVEMAVKGET